MSRSVPVKVKICGVRSPEFVDAAVEAGADYVGVVFFERSPRNVTLAEAALVTKSAAGRIRSVAVMVDPDEALIEDVIAIAGPDMLQLHGSETPERVSEIKLRFGRPVIKAISIATAKDALAAENYWQVADLLLFDAKADAAPGGNGIPFDWQAIRGATAKRHFGLSGGLNAVNVAEAIRITGAGMVDVSSGVERRPGEKDRDLVRRFVLAARAAVEPAEAIVA
jgi:phosphoribosylanthranilate isomerase